MTGATRRLDERREAADVGEHRRADLATAAEAEVVVGPLEQFVHHVLGDEPREDPAHALLLKVVQPLLRQARVMCLKAVERSSGQNEQPCR